MKELSEIWSERQASDDWKIDFISRTPAILARWKK
jgi:hypothetical protein